MSLIGVNRKAIAENNIVPGVKLNKFALRHCPFNELEVSGSMQNKFVQVGRMAQKELGLDGGRFYRNNFYQLSELIPCIQAHQQEPSLNYTSIKEAEHKVNLNIILGLSLFAPCAIASASVYGSTKNVFGILKSFVAIKNINFDAIPHNDYVLGGIGLITAVTAAIGLYKVARAAFSDYSLDVADKSHDFLANFYRKQKVESDNAVKIGHSQELDQNLKTEKQIILTVPNLTPRELIVTDLTVEDHI